jgi:glycosyltransferase involved in cell wall biosynthesis
MWGDQLRISGLIKKLSELRPQIVQTFDITNMTTCEAALAKLWLGYMLFLEAHRHASVFPASPPSRRFKARLCWPFDDSTLGRAVGKLTEKCYPISTDAAEIAIKFYSIKESQIKVVSLGVDTDLFRPLFGDVLQQTRQHLRQQLGFSPVEIVCIYTGRFSMDKNPLCLAKAIDSLVTQGEPFRGLFVGSGSQADVDAIRSCKGCVVHPFVPTRELPPYYWASDIGVWPKQESTSQLDAVGCGLPLILSNRVEVLERVEGNGLLYEENDSSDLALQLHRLSDPKIRQRMGAWGVKKIQEHYTWTRIASQRLEDYATAWEHRRYLSK